MYKNPDVWSPGWGSRRWLWPAELGGTGYVFVFYPGEPTSAGGFVRIGTFPKMVSQNDVNFLLNHDSGVGVGAWVRAPGGLRIIGDEDHYLRGNL